MITERKDISVFTARNRQNPFAKRRREQAEQAAEQAKAVEFDRNPESEEYVQAPDISTYATGGVVEAPKPAIVEPSADELPAEIDEDSPTPPLPDAEDVEREAPAVVEISPDTQAKIEAVMNHAIPPVADERPDHPGPRGAEHMRPLTESEPVADEPKRGRGRPRPQETIDRDNAVHELLKAADADEGVSKEALAISLDEKEQQVYSSLRQLSKEGRAENRYVKPHGYRWFAL